MDLIDVKFDLHDLKEPTETTDFVVEREHCREYALATNDSHPSHVSGDLVPPVYLVVATVPHVHQILRRCVPAAVREQNRSVHGEHDIHYRRPLRSGEKLRVGARVFGVKSRSSGTVLVTRATVDDEEGRLVQEQYFVNFLRGVRTEDEFGSDPPSHVVASPSADPPDDDEAVYAVDADQTYRYADASGDRSVYHLDDAAARRAGFPGIIVHGLCMMAFAGRAVVEKVCDNQPERLERFAVRFSHPVLPSQLFTARMWTNGERAGARTCVFEGRTSDGDLVMTSGLAEVGPSGASR